MINLPALAVGNSQRYFKIDQHLALYFEYYGACLSTHPSFLCSLMIMITPFFDSMISTDQETEL